MGKQVTGRLGGSCGIVKLASPPRQLFLYSLCAFGEDCGRPAVILLQVPPQIVGFNGAKRGGEFELTTFDLGAVRISGVVDQLSRREGSRFALGDLFERRGFQLQFQLGHRAVWGFRPWFGGTGHLLSERGEDLRESFAQPTGADLDWNSERFFIEPEGQRRRLNAGQQQRDYSISETARAFRLRSGGGGVVLLASFDFEGFTDFFAHPRRIDRDGAKHNNHLPSVFDGALDFRRKLVGSAEVARIYPNRQFERFQSDTKFLDESVVPRRM